MEGYIQSGYGNIITPFGERNGEGSAKPRESQAVGARGPDWSRAWAVNCGSRAYFTPGMKRSPYRILPQVEALDGSAHQWCITYQSCQRVLSAMLLVDGVEIFVSRRNLLRRRRRSE